MEIAAGKTEAKPHTLTKADLVERVIQVTELPRKDSEAAVEIVFESITQALQKSEKIEIRGFGSFRTRDRRGRIGRNPKTGEEIPISARRVVTFRPGQKLKARVEAYVGAKE